VPLAAHPAGEATLPTDRLISIADHLERDCDRTLMIPAPPDGALAAFRVLFAALPPVLRRQVNFDTLWTGDPAGQQKCHLAGGYSADNVRTWVSRRYVRLSLPGWDAQPPFEPLARHLPTKLLATASWDALPDEDRDVVYRVGQALAAGRIGGADVTTMTPAAIVTLESSEAVRSAVVDAIPTRLAGDVDPAVARLPKVQEAARSYFDVPLAEQLVRLSQPMPGDLVLDAVHATLLDPNSNPSAGLLDAVAGWTGGRDPQLLVALAWWRGSDPDYAGLEQYSTTREPGCNELNELRHLAGHLVGKEIAFTGDDQAGLIEALQPGADVSPETIRWARLAHALAGGEPTPGRERLRLMIDYHTDPARLIERLHEVARIIPKGILLDIVLPMLRVRMVPGWEAGLPEECLLGMRLVPETPQDVELLDFVRALRPDYIRRLLFELVPQANPDRTDARKDHGETSAITNTTQDLFKRVMEAKPSALKAATEALRDHLKKRSPEEFQHGANDFLFTKVSQGHPVLRWNELSEDFTIGFQLRWGVANHLDRCPDLFRAVAGSVIPAFDHEQVSEGPLPARFIWLLARIAGGIKTGHWTVDQGRTAVK
jgi:hypothetical protein